MSEPEGRRVAENILKAAGQLNTHPERTHQEDDPYYWEPEYPDEAINSLSLYTILSHNIHYTFVTCYNYMANIGFRILDFMGLTGSNYDWIQQEIERERDDLEYEEREKREWEEYKAKKAGAYMRRKQNSVEMGQNVS